MNISMLYMDYLSLITEDTLRTLNCEDMCFYVRDDNLRRQINITVIDRRIAGRRADINVPFDDFYNHGTIYFKDLVKDAIHMTFFKDLGNGIFFRERPDIKPVIGNIKKDHSGRYKWEETRKIPEIKKVIFNNPATIVLWKDETKTVVKSQPGETYDKEKGLAMCIVKKTLGTNKSGSNYYKEFDIWKVNE